MGCARICRTCTALSPALLQTLMDFQTDLGRVVEGIASVSFSATKQGFKMHARRPFLYETDTAELLVHTSPWHINLTGNRRKNLDCPCLSVQYCQ